MPYYLFLFFSQDMKNRALSEGKKLLTKRDYSCRWIGGEKKRVREEERDEGKDGGITELFVTEIYPVLSGRYTMTTTLQH